jgi:ABC-type phosphate transport system substrate-binding protein
VHPQQSERSLAVKDYLGWVYGPGQDIAREQGYITLPPLVLQKVRAKVAALAGGH